MGFFDKLNPFHKKEKSPDFDMGAAGKDPFGPSSGADFGSQNFPDAWNSGTGMDQGMGGLGGGAAQPSYGAAQPQFGQQQPYNQPSSYQQPSQPSFSQPPPSSFGSAPSYSQSYPSQPSPSYGNDADYMHSKNLEVVSSKLDALRAAIDSINARLQNIERIAGQEEENRRKRYY